MQKILHNAPTPDKGNLTGGVLERTTFGLLHTTDRSCRLTILGKTNRPANPLRVGRLDRGALLCITQDKGVRDMDEPMGSMATVKTIEMVEQHAYLKMAELIDGNHLAEARQVAEILKEVGIV